ncbi:methyltransferase domain-containing protein [Streptomyces radicis]|uniref:Protein-L-isoaspartate O-methyltransferase n=1 Tax=Streptomyces radicis TaxID=1750517 RepID=A0A3A9W2E7_9ACTN|nr:methyltransferase domain-containing protein [Streptomyces radicis]RKN07019.1 methyltransferase domain-containing protein [Streptomyces radicis]RKN15080.1 methyltransferase domain-containing protein [Streptomyces radicis]
MTTRTPGAAADPAWAAAFAAVPRAAFLPRVMWPYDEEREAFDALDLARDPEGWRRAAEADVPIVTQWDDGAHAGSGRGAHATSSASTPRLVAAMLAALDAEPGMRVLEVGTGTGWNAALLAHRLGERSVTTVEIDPGVAATARRALRRAGLRPRVVVGDGALGVPDGGPYDRIIVTCGLRRVPREWLAQVRPGGSILAPWGTAFRGRDALVRLTVRGDGTAEGPFLQVVNFMPMRAHRTAHPTFPPGLPLTDTRTGAWPPHGMWHPFPFLAGMRVERASHAVQRHDDGHTQWLYDLSGAGWTAAVRRERTGPGVVVRRAGERPLWDELLAAWEWWRSAGEPPVGRFGLSVDDKGETPWLDRPDRPVDATV